jgi:uncharacterized protein
LHTRDGVQLAARSWLTASSAEAAVVVVHGFSASSTDPHVEATAVALHALDLDVVTYDARGHGASGGASTLGDLERHDVAAAVEAARERTDRVIVVGASMGAIAALRYAAEDPSLTGIVSVSCPARWRLPRNPQGLAAAALTRTPPGRAFLGRVAGIRVADRWSSPAPPVKLVERIGAPVAIVHGDRDRFIGAGDAVELHGLAASVSRLSIVAGMGHAYSPVATPAVTDAVRWLLTRLPSSR